MLLDNISGSRGPFGFIFKKIFLNPHSPGAAPGGLSEAAA